MEQDIQQFEVETNHSGPSPSFAARARELRQRLMDQQSVILEVPGYWGVLSVEYRAVDYRESKAIHARLSKIRDESEQELYAAADHMIAASINAYDMTVTPLRELGVGWGVQLAKWLGADVSDDLTPRQAVLACFPRQQLLLQHFYADYSDWLSGATLEVEQEQERDFRPNP